MAACPMGKGWAVAAASVVPAGGPPPMGAGAGMRATCTAIVRTPPGLPARHAQVLKFAIDAVKAEAFNPKTLFLFGSYTIGARAAWGIPGGTWAGLPIVGVCNKQAGHRLGAGQNAGCLL